MSLHLAPHLCPITRLCITIILMLLLLHYQILRLRCWGGCQVTPGSICFICYLETAPANTDTDWTAQSTAVLIKLGMFILITDISLIAPQHQKVIRRQQLSSVSLRSLFRRRQMLLISFSVLLNPRSF